MPLGLRGTNPCHGYRDYNDKWKIEVSSLTHADTDLPDIQQAEVLQGRRQAEGTSLAEEHHHSSWVAQGMVELPPVVGILFPSSEIVSECEKSVWLIF